METLIPKEARTTVTFPRFGTCTFADDEILSFPWGLPGFHDLRRFVALQQAGKERFVWLQSLDDLSIALPMTDPWGLFDDYEPRLPAYAQAALDLRSPEDFVIYAVVVADAKRDLTVNLLAPIVINLRTRTGRQVPLEGQAYSVRTPVERDDVGEGAAS